MSPSEVAEEHQQEAHRLTRWSGSGWRSSRRGILLRGGLKDFFTILLLGLLRPGGNQGGDGGLVLHAPQVRGQLGLHLLIVPAIILATVLVLALVPDQAMKPTDTDQEETVRRPRRTVGPGPAPPRRPLGARVFGSRVVPVANRTRGPEPFIVTTLLSNRCPDRPGDALPLGHLLPGPGESGGSAGPLRRPGSRGLARAGGPFRLESGRAGSSPRTTWPIAWRSPRSSSRDARSPVPGSPASCRACKAAWRGRTSSSSRSPWIPNTTRRVLSAYAERFGASPDRWWFLDRSPGDRFTA